jgi:hypothetical protein
MVELIPPTAILSQSHNDKRQSSYMETQIGGERVVEDLQLWLA